MMGSVLYSMGNIIKKFSDINFSSYCEKFIENWDTEMIENEHNSKNKNRKNLKFDFSFDLADCGSFI